MIPAYVYSDPDVFELERAGSLATRAVDVVAGQVVEAVP